MTCPRVAGHVLRCRAAERKFGSGPGSPDVFFGPSLLDRATVDECAEVIAALEQGRRFRGGLVHATYHNTAPRGEWWLEWTHDYRKGRR